MALCTLGRGLSGAGGVSLCLIALAPSSCTAIALYAPLLAAAMALAESSHGSTAVCLCAPGREVTFAPQTPEARPTDQPLALRRVSRNHPACLRHGPLGAVPPPRRGWSAHT